MGNFRVYARPDSNGRVEKIFSTCFEQPKETDILIEEGEGDKFSHVQGRYKLFGDSFSHRFKIQDGKMVETSEEERRTEIEARPKGTNELEEIKTQIDTLNDKISESGNGGGAGGIRFGDTAEGSEVLNGKFDTPVTIISEITEPYYVWNVFPLGSPLIGNIGLGSKDDNAHTMEVVISPVSGRFRSFSMNKIQVPGISSPFTLSNQRVSEDGKKAYFTIKNTTSALNDIGFLWKSFVTDGKVIIINPPEGNSAVGISSLACGEGTLASGRSSSAFGIGSFAMDEYSHAEGFFCAALGKYSHAEGMYSYAGSNSSHAEGSNTVTNGYNSHAEGFNAKANGEDSHAEGGNTTAIGDYSHAEGCGTTSFGQNSHAEGNYANASSLNSHAEGNRTTAMGVNSHAEGNKTTAMGVSSHAEGGFTKASNDCSHAGGHYNADMTTGGTYNNTTGTAFVIGNGISSAKSNAFSVQFDGTVKSKSTITASTTADYAEYFEWIDKNPDNEDRVGYFVTLDGNEIRIANDEDDYILGVISGEPFVLGNGDCDVWNGMHLRDKFRRTMYEPAPLVEEVLDEEGHPTGEFKAVLDEEGNPVYQGTRPVLNPNYDHTKPYTNRADRPEWSAVGMLGVLPVRHDGTAKVNGYVTVNKDGIATACEKSHENSYRVIHENADDVVEIIFR